MSASISGRSPQPALALVGNPGTGKSTLLNGLVSSPVFKSGMSFGTGLTTCLQKYEHDGLLYFDTPGLNDVKRRKEAGEEIDKLLRQDVPMKVVFVVFALNGRILPEDAMTIRLVLDAITSVDTNDRFGVIINQAPAAWIDALKADPISERSVRSSYTGERYTSHWFYVPCDEKLTCVQNGMITSPALSAFFEAVPETKPIGATVENVDTASIEEKLEQERRAFEERAKLLQKELELQTARIKSLEMLTTEMKLWQARERDMNAKDQEDFKDRQKELQKHIDQQTQEIEQTKMDARMYQGGLEELRRAMLEREHHTNEFVAKILTDVQSSQKAREEAYSAYRKKMDELEKKKGICVLM